MSGGNFFELEIDARGVLEPPRGPLTLARNEEMRELYAWVMQTKADGTGAVCRASQNPGGFPDPEQWTTRDDRRQAGTFRPGPATGIAVAISRYDPAAGEPRVYWWSEAVWLQRAGIGGGGVRGDGAREALERIQRDLDILRRDRRW